MSKPVIIIPSYQPDSRLIALVKDLCTDIDQQIIIVDDGSTGNSAKVFKSIEGENQVDVLHHKRNLGKGQALKTGFDHFLKKYSTDSIGIVTADADGQHSVKDINKVSNFLQEHKEALILGSRRFEDSNVPGKSLIGNKITIFVFKLAAGVELTDTQTGLRGIPTHFLFDLKDCSETGYDFELEMLLRAARNQMDILEIPIKTIYYDKNKGSHFNPLQDSIKVYSVFFRYIMRCLFSS